MNVKDIKLYVLADTSFITKIINEFNVLKLKLKQKHGIKNEINKTIHILQDLNLKRNELFKNLFEYSSDKDAIEKVKNKLQLFENNLLNLVSKHLESAESDLDLNGSFKIFLQFIENIHNIHDLFLHDITTLKVLLENCKTNSEYEHFKEDVKKMITNNTPKNTLQKETKDAITNFAVPLPLPEIPQLQKDTKDTLEKEAKNLQNMNKYLKELALLRKRREQNNPIKIPSKTPSKTPYKSNIHTLDLSKPDPINLKQEILTVRTSRSEQLIKELLKYL